MTSACRVAGAQGKPPSEVLEEKYPKLSTLTWDYEGGWRTLAATAAEPPQTGRFTRSDPVVHGGGAHARGMRPARQPGSSGRSSEADPGWTSAGSSGGRRLLGGNKDALQAGEAHAGSAGSGHRRAYQHGASHHSPGAEMECVQKLQEMGMVMLRHGDVTTAKGTDEGVDRRDPLEGRGRVEVIVAGADGANSAAKRRREAVGSRPKSTKRVVRGNKQARTRTKKMPPKKRRLRASGGR